MTAADVAACVAGIDPATRPLFDRVDRLYGWEVGRDNGFAARHPELDSGKGTLRLGREAAAGLDDEELRGFLRAVFA